MDAAHVTNSSIKATAVDRTITYREALFESMHSALQDHENVILLGQGIDDHKAIFGTTLGLVDKFGKGRVMDLPLAEEGMMGVAIGAALNGLYPIQTHIRADFVMLAMNQIVNLMAKYKYMFGGYFQIPMLIRIIIGRGWGQGAQHSQSLQSLFAHIPGLRVIMPASSQSVLDSYSYVLEKYRGPVLSLEHRLIYDLKFRVNERGPLLSTSPWTSIKVREGRDVTVVATSIMVMEALRAAEHLAKMADIQLDVIDMNCVTNPDVSMILESVRKTGRLVVADTSWKSYGVCAEVCRLLCEAAPSLLKAPVVTLGLQPTSCPTAKKLEDQFYPNLRDLVDAIAKLMKNREDHGIPLPEEKSMTDVYKSFRGPF